jgi:methylenetetrahydrofolate reductase (NADPH)
MNDQSSAGPTSGTLQDRLRQGRFAITAEIAPPVSCDADDLRRKAGGLHGFADAVNVTDGAGARAHLSTLAAASILMGMGIEPIVQLTCRDRNRIALQSELMGAAALGVRNLLLLTGDDPKSGDQPDTKPVFDIDSMLISLSARPIFRSTRRRAGSRIRFSARSSPARNSRKPSSAWMRRSCAAMSACSNRPASPGSFQS